MSRHRRNGQRLALKLQNIDSGMSTSPTACVLIVALVSLCVQSTVAIKCYDCSDNGHGCTTCPSNGYNCTTACQPCTNNTAIPTCDADSTCYVLAAKYTYSIGQVDWVESSCVVDRPGTTTEGKGCYTYTVVSNDTNHVGNGSATACNCNSDRCNNAATAAPIGTRTSPGCPTTIAPGNPTFKCYDCSDTGQGCTTCPYGSLNCQCQPCTNNTSIPTCDATTTCWMLESKFSFGGDNGVQRSCFQDPPGTTIMYTGCYIVTTVSNNTSPGSGTATACYCNSDRCNDRCDCAEDGTGCTSVSMTTADAGSSGRSSVTSQHVVSSTTSLFVVVSAAAAVLHSTSTSPSTW